MKNYVLINRNGLYWERYGSGWTGNPVVAQFLTEAEADDAMSKDSSLSKVLLIDICLKQEVQGFIDVLERAKILFDE